jgi:hypothetical protein
MRIPIRSSLVSILISLASNSGTVASPTPASQLCDDFHPPNSAFGAIESEYADSVLFVKSGDSVGEAFLIDVARRFYLTVHHVIVDSSGSISHRIVGTDRVGRSTLLRVVDDDAPSDIALLVADDTYTITDAFPFELFLDIAPHDTLVTFSGLAFAKANNVSATSPSPNTFTYDKDMNILLRSNTFDGDSGAPLYSAQGVVVGIVDEKQTSSQGIALPIKKLVWFLEKHSESASAAAAKAFFVGTDNLLLLKQRLEPKKSSGHISNLDLDGAINLMISSGDLQKMQPELVYCPIITAAHHRGLEDAIERLEVAEAKVRAENQINGTDRSVTRAGRQKEARLQGTIAEKTGDILLDRSNVYLTQGDQKLSQRMALQARDTFAEAIADALKSEHGDQLVATLENSQLSVGANVHNISRVVTNLGLPNINSQDIADTVATNSGSSGIWISDSSPAIASNTDHAWITVEPRDRDRNFGDSFVGLLNKFYTAISASAGAQTGETDRNENWDNVSSLRLMESVAALTALYATSPTEKADAYKRVADSLSRLGRSEEAARFYAEAYRANTHYGETSTDSNPILNNYVDVKSQTSHASEAEILSNVSSERPLSPTELLDAAIEPK